MKMTVPGWNSGCRVGKTGGFAVAAGCRQNPVLPMVAPLEQTE